MFQQCSDGSVACQHRGPRAECVKDYGCGSGVLGLVALGPMAERCSLHNTSRMCVQGVLVQVFKVFRGSYKGYGKGSRRVFGALV